ncbi:hypothetical protein ACSZNY_20515, partial [Aeromonas caviae]
MKRQDYWVLLQGASLVHFYVEKTNNHDVNFVIKRCKHSNQPNEISSLRVHGQGESVNILLNFTQFFETRIEYRFQIFTAHSCD